MPLLQAGMCPLLTESIVAKLASNGVKRVLDFICTEPSKITSQCEVQYKTVLSIRRVLLAEYSSFPLNGLNLYEESIATLSILSTNCTELDDLLSSGIFTGEVTEICGSSAAGKTQLCTGLAINIAASLRQNVIYIDCSSGFSPERAAQMIKTNFGETLSHIRVCKCTSTYHLLDILSMIRGNLNSHDTGFTLSLKAIIIDSLSAVLLSDLKNLSYVEGQSLATSVKKEINAIAKDFTLAVVVTTNTYFNIDSDSSPNAGFGHSWNSAVATRIYLSKSNVLKNVNDNSIEHGIIPIKVTVFKSHHAKIGASINLQLTEKGFCPL
uniref:DNA repair protein RAD51 homolog 4-like n=1 Tax=Styela clava TaxID=7725 RepID=UPI0019394021|nr:DNA repair protein RAD51 homolog 4-like [Styela clava]